MSAFVDRVRVDRIQVTVTWGADFVGVHTVTFDYEPMGDDAFAAAVLAKHEEVLRAEAEAAIARGDLPNPLEALG